MRLDELPMLGLNMNAMTRRTSKTWAEANEYLKWIEKIDPSNNWVLIDHQNGSYTIQAEGFKCLS